MKKTSSSRKALSVLWSAFIITYKQFIAVTGIHGLKYTNDRGGNLITKSLWALVVFIAFVQSNVLLGTFLGRYKSNPTRMNVESNHIPLTEMKLPALTFCSINRISYTRARIFIDSLTNANNVSKDELFEMLQVTMGFNQKVEYNATKLQLLQDILTQNRYTPPTVMQALRLPCSKLIEKCRWQGKIEKCTSLLKPAATPEGYCCSFNFQRRDDNSNDAIRTAYMGIANGLSMALAPIVESRSITSRYSDGIRLLVHDSDVYPGVAAIGKMLANTGESFVRIIGTTTRCSDGVKLLSFSERNCLFENERTLRFFKEYRESNCEVDCQMQRTVQACQCIPYYFEANQDIPVCDFTKIACLVDNFDSIHQTDADITCDCPTDCNGRLYDVQSNTVRFTASTFNVDPFYADLTPSRHMIVHVFFGSQVYRVMRRDLLTSMIALVANLGGIYSLFVGVSILAFLEFVFYFTVRLYVNFKKCSSVTDGGVSASLATKRQNLQFQSKLNTMVVHHK